MVKQPRAVAAEPAHKRPDAEQPSTEDLHKALEDLRHGKVGIVAGLPDNNTNAPQLPRKRTKPQPGK